MIVTQSNPFPRAGDFQILPAPGAGNVVGLYYVMSHRGVEFARVPVSGVSPVQVLSWRCGMSLSQGMVTLDDRPYPRLRLDGEHVRPDQAETLASKIRAELDIDASLSRKIGVPKLLSAYCRHDRLPISRSRGEGKPDTIPVAAAIRVAHVGLGAADTSRLLGVHQEDIRNLQRAVVEASTEDARIALREIFRVNSIPDLEIAAIRRVMSADLQGRLEEVWAEMAQEMVARQSTDAQMRIIAEQRQQIDALLRQVARLAEAEGLAPPAGGTLDAARGAELLSQLATRAERGAEIEADEDESPAP